jgi:hypothetical protein
VPTDAGRTKDALNTRLDLISNHPVILFKVQTGVKNCTSLMRIRVRSDPKYSFWICGITSQPYHCHLPELRIGITLPSLYFGLLRHPRDCERAGGGEGMGCQKGGGEGRPYLGLAGQPLWWSRQVTMFFAGFNSSSQKPHAFDLSGQ